MDVLAGVAVVALLALAGLAAGVLRVAVVARRRLGGAVGSRLERGLGRAGPLARTGLDRGIDLAAARVTAPLWLGAAVCAALAALLVAATWDGAGSLAAPALGLLVGLAAARLTMRAARRVTGGGSPRR